MQHISEELLALISEAAVLAKHGRISFANAPAQAIIGADCEGKTIGAVFGEEVAGVQAASFVGDVPIGGGRYIIRISIIDSTTAIFLSDARQPPDLISEAFLCYLRSCLMSTGIAIEMARMQAETIGDRELLTHLTRLNHNNYKLQRVAANASVVRGIQENNLVFSAKQFDLTVLVQSTVDALRTLTHQPELRMSSCLPIYVNADPELIRNMLLNLISNCLSHAAGCSRIDIHLLDCADRVILSVDDDGCGIAPENMHTVFERYRHGFQLKELCRGAGLGLTVARYIARLHGGTMILESKPGRGTVVRVSLSKGEVSGALRTEQIDYEPGNIELLVGMADSLPSDCFCERFSD